MPPHINDRWLWLGFSVFAVLAAHGIRAAIHDIVRLTIIDPEQLVEHDQPARDDEPENSISLPTLATLSQSPNAAIANAAISLLVSRCWRDARVSAAMEADLRANGDEALRRRASVATAFMRSWRSGTSPESVAGGSVDLPYEGPWFGSVGGDDDVVGGFWGMNEDAGGAEGSWEADTQRIADGWIAWADAEIERSSGGL